MAPRFGGREKEAGDSKNMGTPRTHRDAPFLGSAHATASIAGRTGGLLASRSTMFGRAREYRTDFLDYVSAIRTRRRWCGSLKSPDARCCGLRGLGKPSVALPAAGCPYKLPTGLIWAPIWWHPPSPCILCKVDVQIPECPRAFPPGL